MKQVSLSFRFNHILISIEKSFFELYLSKSKDDYYLINRKYERETVIVFKKELKKYYGE